MLVDRLYTRKPALCHEVLIYDSFLSYTHKHTFSLSLILYFDQPFHRTTSSKMFNVNFIEKFVVRSTHSQPSQFRSPRMFTFVWCYLFCLLEFTFFPLRLQLSGLPVAPLHLLRCNPLFILFLSSLSLIFSRYSSNGILSVTLQWNTIISNPVHVDFLSILSHFISHSIEIE